ncbi:MAG: mechanosensitive ion channel [Acidobacteriota bacterium]
MEQMANAMSDFLGLSAHLVLRIFLAVLIFVVGLLLAKVIAAVVRQLVVTSDMDQKIAKWLHLETALDKEGKPKRQLALVLEKVIFFLLVIVVVLFALEMLGDVLVSGVLQNTLNTIVHALPGIFKAILILAFAWIVATIIKLLIVNIFKRIPLGKTVREAMKEGEKPGKEGPGFAESVGNFFFYFVMVLALLPFFQALNMQALVGPLETMFSKAFNYVPNILMAVLVLVLGYFLARLCEKLVANFAQAAGANKIVEGMRQDTVLKSLDISRVVGVIVFILIMIPVLGASFNILNIAVISDVFANIMNRVAVATPNVLAGAIIIIVGLVAGKWLGDLCAKLLKDMGFDRLLGRIGMTREAEAEKAREGAFSLSRVTGNLIALLVIFIFAMEAFEVMRLAILANAIEQLLLYVPSILIALVLVGLGFYLARIVEQLVVAAMPVERRVERDVVSLIVRYAVIVLAFFMAFDQLKIAHNIVVNAFIILLGTAGLGVALAFGLGGREQASSYLDSLKKYAKERKTKKSSKE